ncbi:hypothetical protein [Rivularia sp. UHCC 0363]|uniref:hypothetical protein n=1 Tax=Rivularia sp. UHCC 0363 TaxID=3110244 RepID=UPI002B1F90E1|nr:hypothetical protein [Rivularia sp. UHCC 0363]MEA5594077.1 hypothetical protein [Rivularia sp. UHCC 0363]
MKISDILISRIYKEIDLIISYYAQHNLPAFVKLEVDSYSEFSLITPLDTVLIAVNNPNQLIQYFGREEVMFKNLLDPFTLANQLSEKKADFNRALLKANPGTAIVAIKYWTNIHCCTLLDPIFVHKL